MDDDAFEKGLAALRPRLHRYCARMVGSAVDGEDLLQDTLVKAVRARAEGAVAQDLEAWLLAIAHNICLDFLRARSRHATVPLVEEVEAAAMPEADIVAVSFHAFLRLPELQRCAVILKDVLGHEVEEVAAISGATPAAAKSALQRGRAALRRLAEAPDDPRLPLMSDAERRKMAIYVRLFQAGDFDGIRGLLAEDVRLDLVNRLSLAGRGPIGRYFTRYAEEPRWRFDLGAIEGRPAVLVFDETDETRPAHFVLLGWRGEEIAEIRDFVFAPYAMEAADWVRLG